MSFDSPTRQEETLTVWQSAIMHKPEAYATTNDSMCPMTTAVFDVSAIRRDFPILNRPLPNGQTLVYLDSGASAQKPQSVIDKMTEIYSTCYSNTHRGIHTLGDLVTTEVENARENIRDFIGAKAVEEVIFTQGTTASINTVAYGWARKFLKPGDEVLLNVMEHHANFVPWQQAALATGAKLRFIPLTQDGRLDLERLDEVLTERTKLLAVTGMSNVLGTINPIKLLADRAHAKGALIFVDGAQSVPHGPVNVTELDIDFLAFSGHKLYGPSGIGVLWGKRRLLESMDPFLFGGNMIREVFLETSTWGDLPAKFEAGTMPIAEAVGLGTAIDYVRSLDPQAVHTHEMALTAKAFDRLHAIPGVTIYGPGLEHRGSIVSFTVDGVHPHDLADLFNNRGVAIRAGHHCTMPLHEHLNQPATARASFTFYNTLDEVDALADAILYAKKVFRR
jgi:cysteine desulfurase/selenocysteine lyase